MDDLQRRQRLQRRGTTATLLLLAAALVAWHAHAWRSLQAAQRTRLAAQVDAVHRIVAQQLQATYNGMVGLRSELAEMPDAVLSVEASRRLQALADATPGLRTTALLDSDGRVLASNRPELLGRAVAENARLAADADAQTLHVSPPFRYRMGAVSINVTLPVQSRRNRAHAMAIMLDPDFFRVVLGTALYAPDMWALVAHPGGGLLVLEPMQPSQEGADLARPQSLFADLARQATAPGARSHTAAIAEGPVLQTDGKRLVAWRSLTPPQAPMDLPLVLMISRDSAQMTSGWRFWAGVSAASWLLLAAGCWLGLRHVQQRQRAAAEQQRVEAERLDLALCGADLGLWDLDLEQQRLVVDARSAAMLGIGDSAVDMPVDAWRDRVHPDDLAAHDAALHDHLAGHSASLRIAVRMRHADGRWRWIQTQGRSMSRAADGTPRRVLGTHMDVSERKAAEAAQRSLEDQLRESQKREAIGTLASGIAHDFNNVLGAVLGSAELARQTLPDAASAQPHLAQIRSSGLRGRDLVRRLLAYARRQDVTPSPLRLDQVVQETRSMLRALLPASVQLAVTQPDDSVVVHADATQLQQVLLNLVTNAWHALPGGQGHVEIGIEQLAAPPAHLPAAQAHAAVAWAHLWVRDDGAGMTEEVRARIFDPYFTTKPVGQGTGLGLAVAQGIVRSCGGAITVQSEPGQGSTFHVHLPACAPGSVPSPAGSAALPGDGRPPAASQSAPNEALGTAARSESGRHVLYVDDDVVIGLVAAELLRGAGFRVSTASDALLAVAQVEGRPDDIDLVITDMSMPQMSGLELARRVRAARGDLPVLIGTGLVSDSLRRDAASAGVHAVLHKEDYFETLVRAARAALAGSRQPA